MSEFSLYLILGFEHISDWGGYDHMLFLTALCAVYRVAQWRRVVILVTAFTIGHSLTLALAAAGLNPFSAQLIETLIPITILAVCLYNFVSRNDDEGASVHLNYFLALFFGLIHGLGFSNYLRALLGQEENLTLPLLAFNLGLELGQLAIVAVLLAISYIVLDVFKTQARLWRLLLSGATAALALGLLFG